MGAADVAELERTAEAVRRYLDDVPPEFDTAPEEEAAPLPFVEIDLRDIAASPAELPEDWWAGYLPAGVVTLLGAHGGTGKTFLALMLAVSTATGRPLFGVPTRRGVVAFFSAEDSPELVRHRLRWICRALEVDVDELTGRLIVLDATDGDPTLYHEVAAAGGGRRHGATTPTFAALRDFVATRAVDVLIIDNASDVFDASEIDRARVRGFMRALTGIAKASGMGVLLLAHVDKGTSRGERSGTEGYSGSTAWHNSARSRLFLSRDKDGTLKLEHQKANLGRQRADLRLTWPEGGVMQADEPIGGMVAVIAERNDTKALLRLIHEFTERGEFVSAATTSRTHAGKLLRMAPGFPRNLPDGELFELLRQAERRGWLERIEYRGTDRKPRERWNVTAQGCRAAELAATAATAATTEVPAHGAPGAEPCGDCGDFAAGGVGGRARTEVAAEVSR
ncbi:AAA family ATPase [Rubrivivax gelatinosus]|uniref:AAA family ATPase n=1 Tax=Rubrivivax gelatinosus TaxID=28068 RepID=UPI0006820787|nr:AAA family ATPase [Rubrivivax gelatinosus]MBG6082715.1 KaiC/GvpD/RAD55 family RecA-like ATPase [Rubrivivax gelatinosus]